MKTRIRNLATLPLFDRPWPVGLEICDIPFSVRATNALRAGGLNRKELLAEATIGQLLKIPSLGIKSLLEIAVLTETAIDLHWRVIAELAKSFALQSDLNGGAQPPAGDERAPSAAPAIPVEDWKEILTAALEEPWIDQIDEHDWRFRALFPPGHGTLEDRIERAISDPASSAAEIPGLVEKLPRIRAAVRRMATQPLEDALKELLLVYFGTEEQRVSAMAARFGWSGQDPKTLQECGDMLSITRERVRQIEEKLRGKLTAYPLYLPQLDAALTVLENAAPSRVTDAGELLTEAGVCRRPFSPISIIETARLFGRKTNLAVEMHRGERMLVSGEQGQALGVLSRAARKLAGQSGVASVYQVVDSIAELLAPLDPPDIDEDDVRRILKSQQGCKFLDEDWFWLTNIPEGRNRLENLTKKMLSVAAPQTVASIREGVRRAFKWRAATNERYRGLTVPPQAVLAAFFANHPAFRLDGESVSPTKPLDYRKLLGQGEQTLVDVLRGVSSGILDRKSLIRECLARGINENTLAVFTSYSPVIEHPGLDLWQLRGVRVDPATVEAVRQQNAMRPRETRLQDFGWSADGKLWVTWTLPELTGTTVLGIPGAIKRYLSGRTFEAHPKGLQRNVAKISITDEGTSYGYPPFFRYSGADHGDLLRAEFDLSTSIVELSLTDDAEEVR